MNLSSPRLFQPNPDRGTVLSIGTFFTIILLIGGINSALCQPLLPKDAHRDARALSVADESPEIIKQTESLLLYLHNGLVRTGSLNAPLLTAANFWDGIDSDSLLNALSHFSQGLNGGVLTSRQLFPPGTLITASPTANQSLSVSVAGSESLFTIYRRGLINCQLKQLSPSDPDRAVKLQGNLRCLFAEHVRQAYLPFYGTPTSLDAELVQNSGAFEALSDYLNYQVSRGIIEQYELDEESARVGFQLSNADPFPPTYLGSLQSVNPFPNTSDEALEVTNLLNRKVQSFFVLLGEPYLASIHHLELEDGLRALAEATALGAQEKRRLFFETIGYGLFLEGPRSPAVREAFRRQARSCSYDAGTVTPCNRTVAVLWGSDYGAYTIGQDGFRTLQATLRRLGYNLQTINFQSGDSPRGREMLLRLLRMSQTVIMNVHGGITGYMEWMCYADIEGATREGVTESCCEAMKRTAIALNLDGAREIDCKTVPRPFQDPTKTVLIDSSGECYRLAGAPLKNRCRILVTGDFYNLDEKAAVFTGQCFGARCPVTTAVKDFFTQTAFGNYPTPEKCDDKQLSSDLRGEAMYCIDTENLVGVGLPGNREPWRGRFRTSCTGENRGAYPGSPSPLRSVQSSVVTRGTDFAGLTNSCTDKFDNLTGLQLYSAAQVLGDSATAVEFAPTPLGVNYVEGYGIVSIPFSSDITPGCSVEIEAGGGARQKISSDKPYSNKICSANGVSIVLSGDPAVLPRSKWARDPAELKAIYGVDQSNWPWYIKITVKAEAPNKVAMIGNLSAQKKWLWAPPQSENSLPPYRASLGMAGAGGNQFEVRLPVEPSMSCCMPKITWDTPPDGSRPSPSQNGCACVKTGKDFCFTGTCVTGDATSGYHVSVMSGMLADECSGSYRRFDGQWNVWHDCCPVQIKGNDICDMVVEEFYPEPTDCEIGQEYLAGQTWYQYIERSWDESEVQQCEPIKHYLTCNEER